jgi:hypothetical protein
VPETRSVLVLAAAALLLGAVCESRSPFSRSPAAVAMAEPCRYMGTVHKESRQRLEVLRACEAISHGEWECMAGALKAIDREFTSRCKVVKSVRHGEIADEQRRRYAACFGHPAPETIDCAVLSSDSDCLQERCG